MDPSARPTAAALIAQLDRREVTAEGVARGVLDRIAARNPRLNAFVHLDADRVLDQAHAVDRKRAAGEPLGALAGVPVAVKDVLCVEGEPTTCCSRMLANFRPPYDATVISRLRRADAVLVGKTNMDEFAMGSSTENSARGPSRNPWDEERIPGGSSGGSAVAVAADLTPLSARHRHRRLDSPAGRPLRHRRPEADLRPRQPLRPHRLRLVARPGRPVRPRRDRHSPPPGRHRRS